MTFYIFPDSRLTTQGPPTLSNARHEQARWKTIITTVVTVMSVPESPPPFMDSYPSPAFHTVPQQPCAGHRGLLYNAPIYQQMLGSQNSQRKTNYAMLTLINHIELSRLYNNYYQNTRKSVIEVTKIADKHFLYGFSFSDATNIPTERIIKVK